MADKRFVAKNGLDNNSQTIVNVADPAANQDAATKAYVDGLTTDTAITGKLLTGYAAGANTALVASDSILTALGKIQGQLNNKADSSALSSYLPLTGGTLTGQLTVNASILMNRSGAATRGILWYLNSYTAWQDYMGPAGAGQGASGTITAPAGTLVTSWAMRSFIENAGDYGWTFESGVFNSTTPAVQFEIRSSDGSWRSAGSGTVSGALSVGTNLTVLGTASVQRQTKASYDETHYAWGGSQDLNWKRVARIASSATDGWRGTSGYLVVYDENSNHGVAQRTEYHAKFYVQYSSGGTPLDNPSILGSPGAGTFIRLRKLATRDYELQVRQNSDWKSFGAVLQIDSDSGSLTAIEPSGTPPNGSTGVSDVTMGSLLDNINIGGSAPAGSLTGNTLASGVTASSLTSVGTLTGLTVSGAAVLGGARLTSFAPGSSGTSIEAGWDGTQGVIQVYDRTGAAFRPLWLDASTLKFRISGSDKLILDNNGNLLLGTATVGELLTVAGNVTANVYKFRGNTTAPASTDAFIYRPADNTLAFGTSSTEHAKFTPAGAFVIGTDPGGSETLRVGSGGIRTSGTIYANDFVLTGGAGTGTGISLDNLDDVIIGTELSGLSLANGQVLVYDTTTGSTAKWRNKVLSTNLAVQSGGTAIGSRQTLNFISGSNATVTVADDAGNGRVNVTVDATGAVSSVFGRTGAVSLLSSDVTTSLGYTPPATYSLPNTDATPSWLRLGTWTTSQDGRSLWITIVSNVGYNADVNQNQETLVRFKTANGSSNSGGFYGDGVAYKLSPSTQSPSIIRIKQLSTSSYEVWGYFGNYTGVGSFYQISVSPGTAWTHSGTNNGATAPTGTFIDPAIHYLIHTGNYGTYALPITGGTLTGSTTIANPSPVLILKDSDSTGAAQQGWISFQDNSGVERAWFGYGSPSNTNLNLQNSQGDVTVNNSVILTAANIGSHALPLNGGTMAGAITFAAGQTWPIFNQSTTGSAATLTTARNINGVAFNGSQDITVAAAAGTLTGATLASGVTSSSLTTFGSVMHSGRWHKVYDYALNATPTNGVQITTTIPFTSGIGMYTIICEGYRYGGAVPEGWMVSFYPYNGGSGTQLVNHGASSWGAAVPTLKLGVVGGVVCLFLEELVYFRRFTLRMVYGAQSETASHAEGWTASDNTAATAGATNVITPTFTNAFGNVTATNLTVSNTISGSITGSAGSAATATTATNQSGGTVSATTGTFSGVLTATGGASVSVMNSQDGGTGRGLYIWNDDDTNWAIYMGQSGAGRSLSGGTATASIDGRTAHQFRFRVNNSTTQGFTWENNAEQALMSLGGNNGVLYTRGQIYVTTNQDLVLNTGNYNSYAPSLTGVGATGTSWGISITGNAATVTNGVYVSGAQDISGNKRFRNTPGFAANSSSSEDGLSVYQETGGSDAMLTFHIAGDWAGHFGLGGAENDLVWTGWSVGTTRHRILHSGNYSLFTAQGSGINYASSFGWTTTNGSQTGYFGGNFNLNGDGSENQNLYRGDTMPTPFASPGLVWVAQNNDTSSNADGGWDKAITGLDPNKTYRSIVWFRRNSSSTNGTWYHGCADCLYPNGTAVGNPYFNSQGIGAFTQGRWYLSVGYIHANNDGIATSNYGGIYDSVTGAKVFSSNDFRMGSGQTTQTHRTYLYYSTDPSAVVEWWAPRFEEVNGNEPSINSLLMGSPEQKVVVTSTNVGSHALPIVGGTMTGAITFAAGQTWPTFNQSTTGNAATATTLQTARNINGTSFNGSADITTASWGTARTITIGSTGKSVDGSANVSWTLGEIGALGASAKAADSELLDGLDSSVFLYGANGSGVRTAAATQNVYELAQYKAGFWDANGAGWTPDGGWWWGATFAHVSNSGSYNYSGQLAFQNGGGGDNLYARTINNGGAGSWSRLLSSGNYSSYALPISGGTATGNITAPDFILSSDARLKTNLTLLKDALQALDKVSAYRYTHRKHGRQEVGVLAQEVREVLPEAVTEGEGGMLGVSYDRLVPLLLAAVKELTERIKTLEHRA